MPNTIYHFLDSYNIQYQRFDHPAVYTCEEAERLCPKMPGEAIKNLLLRDRQSGRNFLIVVSKNKAVDLKALGKAIESPKLTFASADDLQRLLGVEPGAVTLLGTMNDTKHKVEIIIDQEIAGQPLQCHPLVNTATLTISFGGIERFLQVTGHIPKQIKVPQKITDQPA